MILASIMALIRQPQPKKSPAANNMSPMRLREQTIMSARDVGNESD